MQSVCLLERVQCASFSRPLRTYEKPLSKTDVENRSDGTFPVTEMARVIGSFHEQPTYFGRYEI